MNVSVFYVGSSLLAPLTTARRDIDREYGIDLNLSLHNCGSTFTESEWQKIEADLTQAHVVFVIHVMDGENATRLISLLDRFQSASRTIVVINCMPALMKRTRMGKLDFGKLAKLSRKLAKPGSDQEEKRPSVIALLGSVSSWIGQQTR